MKTILNNYVNNGKTFKNGAEGKKEIFTLLGKNYNDINTDFTLTYHYVNGETEESTFHINFWAMNENPQKPWLKNSYDPIKEEFHILDEHARDGICEEIPFDNFRRYIFGVVYRKGVKPEYVPLGMFEEIAEAHKNGERLWKKCSDNLEIPTNAYL